MYVIYRTRRTTTMISQQVVFHKDTFQIHVDKEYYDNELIHEYHYDILGRCTYSFCVDINMTIRYYFPIQASIFYALVIFTDSQKLQKVRCVSSGTDETNYDIDMESCTHLCTLNSSDAISYIKKYIIKYTLQYHGL